MFHGVLHGQRSSIPTLDKFSRDAREISDTKGEMLDFTKTTWEMDWKNPTSKRTAAIFLMMAHLED